jgi:hypothetical protein
MSDEYPRYFYKYRSVENTINPEADYAIEALINNQAIFSSRVNFNDLFDSKIELVRPTPRQLKELKGLVGKADKIYLNGCINKGVFSAQGFKLLEGIEESFNKLIDSYPFLSVSKKPASNLMWSHYANSHKGFCIEFKSEFMKAEKVTYQDNIPQLNMIEMLRLRFNLIDGEKLGIHIWESLRTKLNEWAYESEYRFQASNAMGKIPAGKDFIKIPYSPEFVESVIFGHRMPLEIKKFIVNRMPDHIKFKQAVAKTSSIEIINSDLSVDL